MRALGLARLAGLVAATVCAACAGTRDDPLPFEDSRLDSFTAPALATFESERDFRRYLRAVERAADERGLPWARGEGVQLAEADAEPCLDPLSCPEEEEAQRIVVTGSRITAPPASITNNQEAAVDEGDIVKQIGRFLVVLQDGRLISIDTRPGGKAGLALVDRIDVYRDPTSDSWYDEILVSGRRIVVTGYSYDEYATEMSILAIDEEGRLSREDTFYISSNDYYDTDNYATRIVGDKFIVYTPINVSRLDTWRREDWPVVRRWSDEGERETAAPEWTLFDASDVHQPVQRTLRPTVHSVSACTIGAIAPGGRPDCDVTAFVGPEGSELYVSADDVFVWTWPGWEEDQVDELDTSCAASARSPQSAVTPTAIYRIPLSGAPMSVMGVRGYPFDQFSIQAADGRFRALTDWFAPRCVDPDTARVYQIAYLDASLGGFGETLRQVGAGAYTETPGLPLREPKTDDYLQIANRFTASHLVYGASAWRGEPPYDDEDAAAPARLVVMPLDRPEQAVPLAASHSMIRLERSGEDVVLTGYRDTAGLRVSQLDLTGAPRIASTTLLDGRYEREGRSHAFNSLIGEDGSGLMGVPTVRRQDDAGRWWWESESSDVSFLAVDGDRQLTSLGVLTGVDAEPHPSYACEVSCVDWYGNSRPIFTDGRVFALSGVSLIEGRVSDGGMIEVGRLDLSAPTARQKVAGLAASTRTLE
jgi:hypothetical protein